VLVYLANALLCFHGLVPFKDRRSDTRIGEFASLLGPDFFNFATKLLDSGPTRVPRGFNVVSM